MGRSKRARRSGARSRRSADGVMQCVLTWGSVIAQGNSIEEPDVHANGYCSVLMGSHARGNLAVGINANRVNLAQGHSDEKLAVMLIGDLSKVDRRLQRKPP
jgi:hypothetical protein